jgi:hypothetical protein
MVKNEMNSRAFSQSGPTMIERPVFEPAFLPAKVGLRNDGAARLR